MPKIWTRDWRGERSENGLSKEYHPHRMWSRITNQVRNDSMNCIFETARSEAKAVAAESPVFAQQKWPRKTFPKTKRETKLKKIALLSVFFNACVIFAQSGDMESRSTIDWTKNTFSSSVLLDLEKSGIAMPSGKMSAGDRIKTELPDLIKDPLLCLLVDNEKQLGDLVLENTITLEQVGKIVNGSKKTPGIFVNSQPVLKINSTIDMLEISSLLIKHRTAYKPLPPLQKIPSRPYTGIIIDARGMLDVQGEFTKDEIVPCLFPKIWDEEMNLVYERNTQDAETEKKQGLVHYDWSEDESRYTDRVGIDPLYISARKGYGRFRTDPVISKKDALKILCIPENTELLRQGKVVILLDRKNLIADAAVPEKTEQYYADLREVKKHLFNEDETPVVQDTVRGIQILYDLKFVADSAVLLEGEEEKVQKLAESLKKLNSSNSYTILVEGHTADVNKPEGQMRLSIERTQTIIDELVKNGLDRSIFSYRGYGGTQPVASNDTPEGRAQNRRVIITARPKATYIQRN